MLNIVEDYFVRRESQQEKSSRSQRARQVGTPPEGQWEEGIVKMRVGLRYLTEWFPMHTSKDYTEPEVLMTAHALSG